ncbi:hypothetical protein NEISICOT_02753 [Neisseria sicca ATCC 29256]|uniref:Uncharacterized protein n=1 Tax=Neisseria sicca ATCC 29256 TaxID=547045 RepID=C6M885_NEISI|nr:hypothetical protein NEISICOT_02753 [Neisseria sicca ATCC 29256]
MRLEPIGLGRKGFLFRLAGIRKGRLKKLFSRFTEFVLAPQKLTASVFRRPFTLWRGCIYGLVR